MAKVMKDIYLTWSWDGDDELLEGFNLSITPSDSDPNNDSVIQQTTNAKKTDILNQGTAKFEHILRNVMLDENTDYISWVQALTTGDDSDWISTNSLTISDDGNATIATTDADGNPISAAQGSVTISNEGIIISNGKFEMTSEGGQFTINGSGILAKNNEGFVTVDIDSVDGSAFFAGDVIGAVYNE